ncbi:MAG TPA: isoprenyl transferase [Dehalococcoidia bacterium]|nr:isoprenyl transferase [Dehalococcoidia bacterium]
MARIGEQCVKPEDEGVRVALARLRERCPEADPLAYLPDVHPSRIPRHIAIIMDGNGRWAQARGFPREFGHRNGAIVVREIVEHCGRLGVEVLTLYSFSLENWKRPESEVRALMQLCLTYLEGEEAELVRNGVRLRVIGRRQGLPDEVVRAIERVEHATAGGTKATLCLAVNYGGRAEIVDAARRLAEDVRAGRRTPESIDEATLGQQLGTAGLPDPDLLIRTGGEARVSNFLLWQISYAEIVVTDTLWPDFRSADLDAAIREFARRKRRFGGVDEAPHA